MKPKSKATEIRPIIVTAFAHAADGTNWHRVVEFHDRDGRRCEIPILCKVDGKALTDKLTDYGYPVPATDTARTELRQSVLGAEPKRRMLLVERPGWYGGRFMLGNESIGNGEEDLILTPGLKPQFARVSQRGSLKVWRRTIAEPSKFSSYLVFALCLGFAAPLLRFTDVESGGFHVWGPSSKGKSTLQLVAATIFGSGEREGGYTRTWKTTEAAVDEIALGHSDHLLILDEIQLLGGGSKTIAQRASDTAYSIASGSPKSRSTHFEPFVPDGLKAYRTLLLSSGERSLTEHARAGGNQRLLGEENRLIDVPVPTKASGIFDRLSRREPRPTSGMVADNLRDAANQVYGVAGRAYVTALVPRHRADTTGLNDQLSRRCRRFLRKARVDQDNAHEKRFAKRFALAYAAGLLAIDYHIVPWKRSLVWRCVYRVYRQSVGARASADEWLEGAVTKVLHRVPQLLKRAVNITNCKARERRQAVASGSVLRMVHSDGQPLIAFPPAVLSKIIGPVVSEKAVAAELERRGMLIPRGDGRRTRQVRVPGVRERRGYYCLLASGRRPRKLKRTVSSN